MSSIPKPSLPHNLGKRQAPQETNIVHVTVTAADTVIYTHTATSYSYIPSYSTITNAPTSSSSTLSNNRPSQNKNPAGINKGAIIGGVVGGVVLIALIALVFLLRRRSRRKKGVARQPQCGYIDDTDPYYQGAGGGGVGGMTSSSVPAPRHLVAPPLEDGQKYYHHEGGYYDDIATPNNVFPKAAYYSADNSVDTLTSGEVPPNYAQFRQVPNQVDNPVTTVTPVMSERHVPHLKETIEEPPHSRD
ncbi:hypothetical protein INT47_005631 [Mucor saturninus]|uniref:Uncharacterized protein n=1 Tax=Mucor saturninus TaxID=64648 RepID=A0A8H7QKM6_9FUNG|nr:hypothetical protein INT47_005631 [Mucor saturninus]